MAGLNKLHMGVWGRSEIKWDFPDFVFQLNILAGDIITLPLVDSINFKNRFKVEWGDGSIGKVTSFNDADKTHLYLTAGVYDVRIIGRIDGFEVNDIGNLRTKLIKVLQWGMPFKSLNFWGCSNLTLNTVSDTLNTSRTTSFERLFYGCSKITTINRINEWDVSGITTMIYIFINCSLFNDDIGTWDMSNCSSFRFGLRDCKKFNQDLSNWRPKKEMDIYWAFESCTSWTSVNFSINNWALKPNSLYRTFKSTNFNSDLNLWDLSNCTSLKEAFSGCTSFNGNLENWDVSSVKDFSTMFSGCTSFNGNLENWDVSNAINMRSMFERASSFNQDIGSWDVSSVNDFTAMFSGCISFNGNLESWDVSNAELLRFLFRGCTVFNQDISLWDTSKVTHMGNMFEDASSFNQNLMNWDFSKVNIFDDINYGTFGTGSGFSPSNYAALLNRLAVNALNEKSLTMGSIKYAATGSAARNTLVSAPKNWTISDGGLE